MENFHLVLSVSNYPPQSNNFFLKSIYFFDITSLLYWNLLRFLICFIRLIPLFLSLTASLFATTSCKNVETLQRKTAFFGFKSLLVTLLCNIILASLLLSIQSCSSSFECGLLLLATSTRGGGGGSQVQGHRQLIQNMVQCLKYFCNWLYHSCGMHNTPLCGSLQSTATESNLRIQHWHQNSLRIVVNWQ